MSHGNLLRIFALITCAIWLGGCARAPKGDRQQNAYWQRVALELRQSEHPRERALAAQLLGMSAMNSLDSVDDPTEHSSIDPEIKASIEDLLADVSRSNDAVALSLAIQASGEVRDEGARLSAARRWEAVEQDNLTPRLLTDTPIGAVLAGARDTTRYETHAYDQIRLMASVFKRFPVNQEGMDSGHAHADDEERAAVSSFAVWAAFGIPGYQKLTNACRGEALSSAPTRREDCLHVAKVMAGNTSDLLSKDVGIGILERAAMTPEDIALAASLRRNKEWQQHQYYEVLTSKMDVRQQVGGMMRLLKTPGVDNEIQLMEAALREKGVSLTPPESWQPPKRS